MDKNPMLTTIDNPYSPFTQWDEWFAFDFQKGYHTPEYLARVSQSTNVFGASFENEQIEEAIDEIVFYNLNGMYKKVFESDFESEKQNDKGE